MLEGIIGHITSHVLDHISRERLWKVRLLPCLLIDRHEDLRISFSAFLRISKGDRYVLVRSLHRREAFGPFGGVYKYHAATQTHLDDYQFRPQSSTEFRDMYNDLRGFIPRHKAHSFLKWFEEGNGREDASTCLRRELDEELREARLFRRHPVPKSIQFQHVRRIQEGPARAIGHAFSQYRIFDFFDIVDEPEEVIQFKEGILQSALDSEDVVLVTARDIVSGRTPNGHIIGHHSGYLFGRRRIRPDEPMFVDAGGRPS